MLKTIDPYAIKIWNMDNGNEEEKIGHLKRRNCADQNLFYSILTSTNVISGEPLPFYQISSLSQLESSIDFACNFIP